MKLLKNRQFGFAAVAGVLTMMGAWECRGDQDLYKVLQTYISANLGKGWVASPYGADVRFRPKTMFIYLDDLQKRFQGKGVEKGWVPFSSGLGIYPDEYVSVQTDKVTLSLANADSTTKWGFLASVQKVLATVGLDASLKADLTNHWDLKVEIEEAETQWVWQDEMRLAQETTRTSAERLTGVLRERYGKVPPVQVIVGALRVKGLSAVAENKLAASAEVNADVAKFFAKLGLSWNRERNRYESLKIPDWQYIAFQAQRSKEGEITISSGDLTQPSAEEVYVPPSIYVP